MILILAGCFSILKEEEKRNGNIFCTAFQQKATANNDMSIHTFLANSQIIKKIKSIVKI
jgi:hypothetical protein